MFLLSRFAPFARSPYWFLPYISQLPHVCLSQHSDHQQHRTTLRATWSSPSRSFTGSLWTRLNLIPLCQLLHHVSVNERLWDCKKRSSWLVQTYGMQQWGMAWDPRTKWTVCEIRLLSAQDDEKLACQHPLIHADHIPPPTQGDSEGRQEEKKRFGHQGKVEMNQVKWLTEVLKKEKVSKRLGADCLTDDVKSKKKKKHVQKKKKKETEKEPESTLPSAACLNSLPQAMTLSLGESVLLSPLCPGAYARLQH